VKESALSEAKEEKSKAKRKQPFESSSEDEVCVPLMIILMIEDT
jgi:hypothetical protein